MPFSEMHLVESQMFSSGFYKALRTVHASTSWKGYTLFEQV